MISYAPLWQTMKCKGVTTYTLITKYHFSRGTLDSLKQGRNVNTSTLNDLCRLLDCPLSGIAEYIPDSPQE